MFIPRLLGDSLLQSAQRNPGKVVVSTTTNEYTYQDLLSHALALADALHEYGIERGDRVAIYIDNSWESIFSIYGVMLAGGVFVVINPQTKKDKLAYILDDSDARCLLTNSAYEAEFLSGLGKLEKLETVIYCGDKKNYHIPQLIKHFDEVLGKAKRQPYKSCASIASDLAALIYTSGSTGFPKGVMHTHMSMRFALDSLVEYLRLSEEHRILNVLPFAFDYGLYQLLMTVHTGATLILGNSFVFPAPVFKRILDEDVTVFPGVPTMFSMLLSSHERKKLSFSSVTRVTNTAAALPADFVPTLKEIFPNALIYKMYGLTECKRVSYLEPELVELHPDSVGRAIPGTEVYLLSPDGEPVAPGEVGILHVRGPHIMLGYWKQEGLSNKMLADDLYPNQKNLCTQDWFRMDEDGLLYFVGRNDDIIKTRGEKVSPVEVENVIYGIKGVKDVAVVGQTDQVLGQSIRAFVSVEQGETLSGNSIKKACSTMLESYMVPKEVVIMEDLPKTANGKIDKKALV